MIGKEIINYALRNLKHRKARSILTIVSIFIGITAIFVFVSFGWGLYDYVNKFTTGTSVDKILIQPKGTGPPGLDTTFALTEKDLEAVRKTSGVYEASGVYSKAAEVQLDNTKKYVFLNAYDPDNPLILEFFGDIGVSKGRLLRSSDSGNVVLGYNYQIKDKIFSKPLDINDNLLVQGKKLKIIGFFESVGNPQDDSAIYVANDFISELYPGTSGNYSWIIARADIENLDATIERVENSVRKSRDLEKGNEDFFVASFQDLLDQYLGALNLIIGFVILIALVSVLVSAINTANSMITSVIERVREIGIIKSIGARNSEIFNLFLFESGLIGFLAGTLGVILGFIITFAAKIVLTNLGWAFLSPHYSISLFLGCILFATLTGAISGAWPAWQASKIKPVDALRYE